MTSVAPISRRASVASEIAGVSFVPWLVIAATPVVFAMATWNTSGTISEAQHAIRLFGIPVVMAEIFTIVCAVRADRGPLRIFIQLSVASKLLLATLGVIALGTAMLAAARPAGALIWTLLSIIHLLFGISLYRLTQDDDSKTISLVWPFVIVGLCLYALLLVPFVLLAEHQKGFDWQYFGFGVTNIRQVGFYSAVGAAASLGLAIVRRSAASVKFCGAASLMLALSFWSGTRGSLVAVAGALSAGSLVFGQLRTIRSAIIIGASTVVGLVVAQIPQPPVRLFGLGRIAASVQTQSIELLSSGRAGMWKSAWVAIGHRPFLGHGEGQFGWVAAPFDGVYLHPHNILLQLLVQWGILGTAIVLLLSVPLVRICFRAVRNAGQEVMPSFLLVTALVILSLYDGTFFHTYSVMMLVAGVAWIIAVGGKSEVSNDDVGASGLERTT